MLLLLFLSLITLNLASEIIISTPDELNSHFTDGKITHIKAPAGKYPGDATFLSELYLANPRNACLPLTPSKEWTNEKDRGIMQKAYLVESGDCPLVTKVRNVMLNGGHMVIIQDKNLERLENGDNYEYFGQPNTFPIPIFIITNKAGNAIQNYLSKEKSSPIVLFVKFKSERSEKMRFEFWFDASDIYSFNVAGNISKAMEQYHLNQILDIEPRFVNYPMDNCSVCMKDDCLGNNRYCLSVLHSQGSRSIFNNGREALNLQLKMKCLFKLSPTKWWKYTDLFRKRCTVAGVAVEQCHKDVLEAIDVNSDIIDLCFSQSFATNDLIGSENHLLRQDQEQYARWHFPGHALLINRLSTLHSLYSPSRVKDQICAAYKNERHETSSYCLPVPTHEAISVKWLYLIFIPLVLCCGAATYYYFKRQAKRELAMSIDDQVQSAIAAYHSLTK